jgi:D-arabinose 1-dehydrogenase-like Zn-dependent alcohol dehydrogenase
MSKMRVVQVDRPQGPLQLTEREIPEPGAGSVRIKIEACGICHGDSLTKEGHWPGIQYPRVPGHEVAGIIDAVGAGVAGWTPGQRVGVGWHGGHCGYCDSCRRGEFLTCRIAPQIPGITWDGGYADYMVAPSGALALQGAVSSGAHDRAVILWRQARHRPSPGISSRWGSGASRTSEKSVRTRKVRPQMAWSRKRIAG